MGFLAVAEELAVKGLTTDSKPAGTDTPAKKAVVSQKQKRSLPPGSSSTPTQAAKKPKPSQPSGADGDDNGDFGAEGEFEGFDQYGEGNEFDDSMGAAGGSGAAADGKDQLEVGNFIQSKFGNALLLDKEGYVYKTNCKDKTGRKTYWICRDYGNKSAKI